MTKLRIKKILPKFKAFAADFGYFLLINRRAPIANAVVSLLNKTKDLQMYGHTFAILYDYLKQFDKDCEEVK